MVPKSKMGKIIFGLVGSMVLLIVIILAVSLVSGGEEEAPDLVQVAISQVEIENLTADASKNAKDSGVKALAATLKVVVASDRAQLATKIPKSKKINDKYIAGLTNKDYQKALDSALTRGTYDKEFIEVISVVLASYQTRLGTANQTADTKTKALIKVAFDNVQTIRGADILEKAVQ